MKRTGNLSRTQIIQYFIDKYGYKSYLEIGVQNGVNFNAIKCEKKVGVDPDKNSKATIFETSDTFFEKNTDKYDIVFIDGLHHGDQVEKDILNSLQILNEGGVIVCHDMIPSSYEAQIVPRQTKHWNGDCWRAFVKLRQRRDLEMRTVMTDCGCGIIRKGRQIPLMTIPETYDQLLQDQHHYMVAISEEEFLSKY